MYAHAHFKCLWWSKILQQSHLNLNLTPIPAVCETVVWLCAHSDPGGPWGLKLGGFNSCGTKSIHKNTKINTLEISCYTVVSSEQECISRPWRCGLRILMSSSSECCATSMSIPNRQLSHALSSTCAGVANHWDVDRNWWHKGLHRYTSIPWMHTNLATCTVSHDVQYHMMYCTLGFNRIIKTIHCYINAVSIALLYIVFLPCHLTNDFKCVAVFSCDHTCLLIGLIKAHINKSVIEL